MDGRREFRARALIDIVYRVTGGPPLVLGIVRQGVDYVNYYSS